MRNFIYSFATLFLLSLSVTFAQQSTTRNFNNFTKLDISGAASVTLKQGNSSSARIKVKGDIDIEDVTTRVRGNTLFISLKKKRYGYRNVDIDIEITFKQLEGIDISGAVGIRSESTIKANHFRLESSGAGSLRLAFDAKKLSCRLSGASSVKLTGRADQLDIDLSGAGSVNAYGLVANIVQSETSGVGSIRVNAQKELYAEVSGVGSIHYKGNPPVKKLRKSGFGSISSSN